MIYTVIVWASVLFSAFIDNIPYVATMLPVVQKIALDMGIDPTVLYFGLLSGATLGGNLTPIGASANITGIGICARRAMKFKIGTSCALAFRYAGGHHSRLPVHLAFLRSLISLSGNKTKVSQTRRISLACRGKI